MDNKEQSQQKEWCVYRHVCPDNSCYIGMAHLDPLVRWQDGKGYHSQKFGQAIRQFGWDNIKHYLYHPRGWQEVDPHTQSIPNVYFMTETEAAFVENAAILSFDSINHGWNVSKGSAILPGISDTAFDEDQVRGKLNLSLTKGDIRRLKFYSVKTGVPISHLLIQMFDELHGDELLEVDA